MRTWGRIYDQFGQNPQWVEVVTDANGFNDYVYATTLIQNLLLNLGESPFYGQNGIPAQRSVIQQIFPDFYVNQIQQQFAQFFASLNITKVQGTPTPTYNVAIVTNQGATINTQVAK